MVERKVHLGVLCPVSLCSEINFTGIKVQRYQWFRDMYIFIKESTLVKKNGLLKSLWINLAKCFNVSCLRGLNLNWTIYLALWQMKRKVTKAKRGLQETRTCVYRIQALGAVMAAPEVTNEQISVREFILSEYWWSLVSHKKLNKTPSIVLLCGRDKDANVNIIIQLLGSSVTVKATDT